MMPLIVSDWVQSVLLPTIEEVRRFFLIFRAEPDILYPPSSYSHSYLP